MGDVANRDVIIDDAPSFVDDLPEEARIMADICVFRWCTPELLKILSNWQTMNVAEISALSRVLRVAAAAGYRYAQEEAIRGEIVDEDRIEVGGLLGLDFTSACMLVPKVQETEAIK